MKIVPLAATGLLLAVAMAAVHAATPTRGDRAHRGDEAFTRTDSNRDGRLSLAEFEKARSERIATRFRKLDLNGDGSLTQGELRQHRELRASRKHGGMARRERLRALDANGDRALTRAEIGDRAPRLAEHFGDFDLDRDGRLSRDEIRAGMTALRQAR